MITININGPHASGKSLIVANLIPTLQRLGFTVIVTDESEEVMRGTHEGDKKSPYKMHTVGDGTVHITTGYPQ